MLLCCLTGTFHRLATDTGQLVEEKLKVDYRKGKKKKVKNKIKISPTGVLPYIKNPNSWLGREGERGLGAGGVGSNLESASTDNVSIFFASSLYFLNHVCERGMSSFHNFQA